MKKIAYSFRIPFVSFLFLLLISMSKGGPTDDITGTSWTLIYTAPGDGDMKYNVVFHDNGRLENHHPNDQTTDNDHWKQKGNTVVMTFNDGYATYTGHLIDADHMKGKAKNQKNKHWKWKATRLKNVR